jgi:hypothetical protein
MALPQFSLKQLLISLTWFGVGFGGIAYSLRVWNLSLSPTEDWLAEIEPYIRGVARLLGWGAICLGIVPLITTRTTASVFADAFSFAIPFGLMAAMFVPPNINGKWDNHSETLFDMTSWIVFAVVSGGYLIVEACAPNPKVRRKRVAKIDLPPK